MSKANRNKPSTADDAALQSRLQQTPIAVVGMASVFADSKSLDAYWDNIIDKVDSIIDVPASRWHIDDYYSDDKSAADKTYCKRGAFIPELDFDPMEFGLPPNILEVTDIAQLIALIVARDALSDAGLAGVDDLDHVGITLGVGSGLKQISALNARLQYPVLDKVLDSCGVNDADRAVIVDKFKKAYIPWEENSFPGMLGNVIAGRVANRFNLGGTNCTVDAACAGSLAAMKLAVSDLLEYRSDAMISGGICCDNSPFMYMSFSKTPAFTTNETIRPFDEDSKGMMVGEGVGMVVLKRLEDAERDGDKIYAVLKGIGTSSDGKFKSIYAPRPDGQAKALRRAYNDAGIDPKTVGLIEAHGTGTLAGDAAEVGGLTKFFSEGNDEKQHIALGSVKSQIGHTKSAAGAAGFVKLCLALHHKVLPASINVDRPAPSLNIEDSPFYINTETRPWVSRSDGAPRRAGVSSFGFGGTNFHFVLEEYNSNMAETFKALPREANLAQAFLFAADTASDLKSNLQTQVTSLDVDEDTKPYAFNALLADNGLRKLDAKQLRIGFVAKNADGLKDNLEKALDTLEKKGSDSAWRLPTGIYFRPQAADVAGKAVALFSGQGSQYVNMASELSCSTPEMLDAIEAMDASFTAADLAPLSKTLYPIPVFEKDDKKAQDAQLQLTQFAQPAIGTVSVGLFNTLKTAGFEANFTAGHSFGELTALWAAGVLSQEDYMMLARSRGQAMAAPDDENFDAGTMVAVVAEPAKVEAEIKDLDGVSVANYNSTSQVVIAGDTKAVLAAHDMLKDKGYKVVKLPVSAAFHTPLVGHAQKPFAKAIASAKFNKPSIPVFSNASGKQHSDKPADIQMAMQSHILESVRFDKEIESIYDAGGRVFVEFGPKNVLSKLVENILADKDDVVSIALNANPKKSSELQLRQAIVELAVTGFDVSGFDPYAKAVGETAAPKKSPMAMKLSAASYVSPKTRKAYEDALSDGYQMSGAVAANVEPKIVEKIVEVEKVVEKIVYVEKDGAPSSTQAQPAVAAPAASAADIAQQLAAFSAQQQQLLDVHQQFMAAPENYAQTVQKVLDSNHGVIPADVAQSLAMYHDFQADTLRVHEQFLRSQTAQLTGQSTSQSIEPVATAAVSAPVSAPDSSAAAAAPVAAAAVSQATQPVVKAAAPASAPAAKPAPAPVAKPQAAAKPVPAAVAPTPAVSAPASASGPVISAEQIQKVMLDVVAEKTGYPVEMLELSMDMEADLGIDSIKRVEILGSVQDDLPDLPELNPEDLAELRTLGQIVDYMNSKLEEIDKQVAAPVAASSSVPASASGPAISAEKVQSVMMDVVADKTGYPTEMLELGMDMEADLGIDSIKRVEILGSVQDELPDLPELNPEDLAELRTLGQIVD
ncbi:MAG: acyltransferase domain-containing protein, partial [Pseudomonadales bacterium]|nr:acyltransferase domain-containing protein [Pseudomonadales bacterium]